MTTGAENDIRQATELARQMVGRFGMSDEIGFVAVFPQDGERRTRGCRRLRSEHGSASTTR